MSEYIVSTSLFKLLRFNLLYYILKSSYKRKYIFLITLLSILFDHIKKIIVKMKLFDNLKYFELKVRFMVMVNVSTV